MKKNSLLFSLFVLVNVSYAQVAPQNILLRKCLISYATQYKHLKGNKAFAYARVQLGEEDHCTWSYKANSVKTARSSALNSCKRRKINAECKIVDIDNKWLVQVGDFSTIMPPDNTPLSKQQVITLRNKAKNIVLGECVSFFNTHLQSKGHKVFAYSIDGDGHYACGASSKHQTLRKAALIALKICETQRSKMKKNAPKHQCLPFSDGKNILVSAKDFNLTLHKKTNKYLNLETYTNYVNKAKKYLHGPCLTQYKYYLRIKDHRAFYLATNSEGAIACGHSFNLFTIASAKKHAREKCELSAKVKKINEECKLFSLDLLSSKELEDKGILK